MSGQIPLLGNLVTCAPIHSIKYLFPIGLLRENPLPSGVSISPPSVSRAHRFRNIDPPGYVSTAFSRLPSHAYFLDLNSFTFRPRYIDEVASNFSTYYIWLWWLSTDWVSWITYSTVRGSNSFLFLTRRILYCYFRLFPLFTNRGF